MQSDKANKEQRTASMGLAKAGVQPVLQPFMFLIQFSAGRQFSSPKSPTSCSCKTSNCLKTHNKLFTAFHSN